MVGRCISYWNNPFLGDVHSFVDSGVYHLVSIPDFTPGTKGTGDTFCLHFVQGCQQTPRKLGETTTLAQICCSKIKQIWDFVKSYVVFQCIFAGFSNIQPKSSVWRFINIFPSFFTKQPAASFKGSNPAEATSTPYIHNFSLKIFWKFLVPLEKHIHHFILPNLNVIKPPKLPSGYLKQSINHLLE